MRVSFFSYHCLPYVHPHKIVTQVHAIAFEHTYSTPYISTLVDKNTVAMTMRGPHITWILTISKDASGINMLCITH